MSTGLARHSLAQRLLWVLGLALFAGLLLSGWALYHWFATYAHQQWVETVRIQLDEVTRHTDFDAAGLPVVDVQALHDPRWSMPMSGLYGQIEAVVGSQVSAASSANLVSAWRSRSLWDNRLHLPAIVQTDGEIHIHHLMGPWGQPLLVLERQIHDDEDPGSIWRVAVALHSEDLNQSLQRFRQTLWAALLALVLLLGGLFGWQIYAALRPLRQLKTALETLRSGQSTRLQGRFPSEIEPLVSDFNTVLAQHEMVLKRAREHAGNLTHAIKTPVTVMEQATHAVLQGSGVPPALSEYAQHMGEQLHSLRHQTDWHLSRARSSSAALSYGQRTPVASTVEGLLRVMRRVHAERELSWQVQESSTGQGLQTTVGLEDLQQMLGNLLDNAGKWAQSQIEVGIDAVKPSQADRSTWDVQITVADDGPGIADQRFSEALSRGQRLDETVPGSGLGLAIAHDLATLYGGQLSLRQGQAKDRLPGLVTVLTLPGAVGTTD